jgi:hypothetical protein
MIQKAFEKADGHPASRATLASTLVENKPTDPHGSPRTELRLLRRDASDIHPFFQQKLKLFKKSEIFLIFEIRRIQGVAYLSPYPELKPIFQLFVLSGVFEKQEAI